MNETGTYLKLVSLLMQYPDDAYFEMLPEVKSFAASMRHGVPRASIENFIAGIEAEDAIHLQEQYTALFDMNPATTLNVTYHLWGDGEKRARLLTRLQQAYAAAGMEKQSLELPDFLPLILEFMARVPGAMRSEAIMTSMQGVDVLVAALRQCAPHYSGLLGPLMEAIAAPARASTATNVS